MQVFTDIVVFILTAYLAFTNSLAGIIETAFNLNEQETTIAEETTSQELKELSKTYAKGGDIPQILIDNATYQKASVVESIPPEKATSTALDALVNIYCSYKNGNTLHVTTGTGFFLDTSGVILTNAHVAQFLLLEDIIGEAQCVIRAGNPAQTQYTAELLYISPKWIRENASLLNNPKPQGTGERDYALLYVTAGVDGKPMPGTFPALPFDVTLLKRSLVNEEVYAAGYPADALLANGADTPLIPKLATTTVAELMTFGSNYADIFSISGSDIGERGSSGGPIVTKDGDTIGMISTKGDDTQFGQGTLRAISISYIDRTITEETGFSLRQNLGGNIPYRARIFKETIVPFLQLLLEQEL